MFLVEAFKSTKALFQFLIKPASKVSSNILEYQKKGANQIKKET